VMLEVMHIFRQAPAGYRPPADTCHGMREGIVDQVPLGVGMCSYCACPTKKKETDYPGEQPWSPTLKQRAGRFYCSYSCFKRDAPWRAQEKAALEKQTDTRNLAMLSLAQAVSRSVALGGCGDGDDDGN